MRFFIGFFLLKPAFRLPAVGRLIRMFTWAAEKELVSPSVPQALTSLAGLKKGRCKARETAGVSCVDDAVVDKTHPQLPAVVADMVRLQRLTGARPGEICSLRPCDLDQSLDVWVYLAPNENLTKPVGHHRLLNCVSSGLKQQGGGWVSLLAAVEGKNCNWLREIPQHGLRILANRHPRDQDSPVGVE